jgi:prepilin-type N-terminal cleavage/methylation domain-containing protein
MKINYKKSYQTFYHYIFSFKDNVRIQKSQRAFTLVEVIVVVGLLALFVGLIGEFQAKIFKFNGAFQGGNFVGTDSQNIIKSIAGEIRSMSPSSAGAYPIENAGTSTFSFFNDVDNDGLKERIRYFVEDSTLKRGLIKPSGNPMTYNSDSEKFVILMSNVQNLNTTPIFNYYNSNYSESNTTPLALPVNILDIRLVEINVILGVDASKLLTPVNVSTKVSIRNLKDNL